LVVHYALAGLLVCACGRVDFDARETLAITSPDEQSEVAMTATVSGTCMPGVPVAVAGSGLGMPTRAPCEAGAFAAAVTVSAGYGEKVITASQGRASATRAFWRIEHVEVRGMASGSQDAQGFNVDCDLVVAAPAGTTEGDLLVGMIYTDGGGTGSISTPGFVRQKLAAATYVAFTKRATASEPASYTFHIVAGSAGSDTCESAGVLVAFSGVAGVLAESGAASLTAPGVDAPKRSLLVGVFGSNGPAGGIHAPAGMTSVASAEASGSFANVLIASEVVAPGPTGSRTATIDSQEAAAAGLLVLDGLP
jgi:hypothetical protein